MKQLYILIFSILLFSSCSSIYDELDPYACLSIDYYDDYTVNFETTDSIKINSCSKNYDSLSWFLNGVKISGNAETLFLTNVDAGYNTIEIRAYKGTTYVNYYHNFTVNQPIGKVVFWGNGNQFDYYIRYKKSSETSYGATYSFSKSSNQPTCDFYNSYYNHRVDLEPGVYNLRSTINGFNVSSQFTVTAGQCTIVNVAL